MIEIEKLSPPEFGVVNINKPKGCTSHDVVARIRRKLHIKKIGHAGTLDPLATGVLPICVGKATRLIEYLPSDKRYEAKITFGATTHTWDAEGEPINPVSAAHLTKTKVEEALKAFEGTISQQVPPHSAVHVKGKKLYEYARQGIEMELPVREATVYAISLKAFEGEGSERPQALIEVHCATGTYIRSIAKALGDSLETGAYLASLIRTNHGRFPLEEAVDLETFLQSTEPEQYMMNPIAYLDYQHVDLDERTMTKISHGMKLQPDDLAKSVKNNRLYLLIYQGLPVAMARGEETGRLKPLKVLA